MANTALMIQAYAITESDNEKVNANNEGVEELVDNLDKAIQSGDKELESIEVSCHCLPLHKVILSLSSITKSVVNCG